MSEMDLAMYYKGYDYKLSPIDKTFEPLYAKTIVGIESIEDLYPEARFRYSSNGPDGISISYYRSEFYDHTTTH